MSPKGNKPLPNLPAFMVHNSGINKKDEDMDAFVFCADYDDENYKQYKTAFKLKTEYKYGNMRDEYDVQFGRKDVKDVIHIITAEIKEKGTKSPYLLLPFRPQQYDIKLKKFLNSIFENNKIASNEVISKIVKKFDEYTLIAALKFFWCRLPGDCVIGWKTYTKFVTADEEAGFPKRAFLDFMPTCLSSGSHASIVYDFFDLIVAIALNSKVNMLSAKKIARVCGLWAFHPVRNKQSGMPSFERGMYEWIPAGDAMYHLLLAFLNAMPPNGQIEKLPKTLQLILRSSPYPPPQTTSASSRHLQEVPMVTLRANNPSKNPAELLARVAKTLKFDDPTVFYTREDYLLLKRLFKDVEGLISKLSSEGSRILDNVCIYDEDLISDGVSNGNSIPFKLIPGWSSDMSAQRTSTEAAAPSSKKLTKDFFTANVSRVSIDDYFIWAWMASLGSEQTSIKKKTFGKTYIMEVELAEGFKKWVIIEEQDIERDGYDIEIEIKQEKLRELEEKIKLAELEAEAIRNQARTRVISESADNNNRLSRSKSVEMSDITNEVRNVNLKADRELPPAPGEIPFKSGKRKEKHASLPPPPEIAQPRQQENVNRRAPPPVTKDYFSSNTDSGNRPFLELEIDDTENFYDDSDFADLGPLNVSPQKPVVSNIQGQQHRGPPSDMQLQQQPISSLPVERHKPSGRRVPPQDIAHNEVLAGGPSPVIFNDNQLLPGSFPVAQPQQPQQQQQQPVHSALYTAPVQQQQNYGGYQQQQLPTPPASQPQQKPETQNIANTSVDTSHSDPKAESTIISDFQPPTKPGKEKGDRTSKIFDEIDNLESELMDVMEDSSDAQAPAPVTNRPQSSEQQPQYEIPNRHPNRTGHEKSQASRAIQSQTQGNLYPTYQTFPPNQHQQQHQQPQPQQRPAVPNAQVPQQIYSHPAGPSYGSPSPNNVSPSQYQPKSDTGSGSGSGPESMTPFSPSPEQTPSSPYPPQFESYNGQRPPQQQQPNVNMSRIPPVNQIQQRPQQQQQPQQQHQPPQFNPNMANERLPRQQHYSQQQVLVPPHQPYHRPVRGMSPARGMSPGGGMSPARGVSPVAGYSNRQQYPMQGGVRSPPPQQQQWPYYNQGPPQGGNATLPHGYYQQQQQQYRGAPSMYNGYGYQQPQQGHPPMMNGGGGSYSDKVIKHLPPSTKGPLNKGKARNALMNGDFGI